jgi:hypothetical protein
VISTAFPFHHVEIGPGREPAGHRCAHSLVCKGSILLINLLGSPSASGCGSIGHELCATALFKADEPKDGGLDGATDGEEAVVLEDDGLAAAERLDDGLALVALEHDAVEVVVHGQVVVEGAAVLRRDVDGLPERAKGPPMDRVRVRRAQHVRPRRVDRVVDRVRRRVEQPDLAALDDAAVGCDPDQVACADVRKGYAKGVDPEGVWLDRVL